MATFNLILNAEDTQVYFHPDDPSLMFVDELGTVIVTVRGTLNELIQLKDQLVARLPSK